MSLRIFCACLALVSAAVACSPRQPEPGASASTSTGAGDSSTGSTAAPTTGTTGTTATVDPCESHLVQADCDAAGCVWFATEIVSDLATCELAPAGACVGASASTGDEEYDSTFFKVVEGVVQLRRVGHKSCDFLGAEHPDGWTECGTGPGDPAECGCVCAAGQCPGDVALAAMEACTLPRPCADISAFGDEIGWDEEDCHYKALAAGDPAALRVTVTRGDPVTTHRVYLRGDGKATRMISGCDMACVGACDDRTWTLPRECAVREAAYFDTCAAAVDPVVLAACRDPDTWFTGCAAAPATCP